MIIIKAIRVSLAFVLTMIGIFVIRIGAWVDPEYFDRWITRVIKEMKKIA